MSLPREGGGTFTQVLTVMSQQLFTEGHNTSECETKLQPLLDS